MLTERGREYLGASALTIAISAAAGPAIAAALGMTLAVMAAISLLLLRYSYRATSASVEPSRLRLFKRETRSVVLRLETLGSGFARVSSVSIRCPFGLEVAVGKLDGGALELAFRPNLAGSFSSIRAVISVGDTMMLFNQTRELELELVVEALPTSLLLQERQLMVAPIMYGEVPTGTRGSGQEHYDIEPYVPGGDANDLMWKRVARFGDDSLQVNVREASMKGDVGIVLMLRADSAERRILRRDLVSEAIAQLGKRLTSLGVRVELAFSHEGRVIVSSSTNLVELTESIVESWSGDASGEEIQRVLARADLAVLGPEEYRGHAFGSVARSRLTLLIWDESGRPDPSGRFFTFSGDDDLTQLAEALVEG